MSEQEEKNLLYEGIFMRFDGELEPIVDNLFIISSENIDNLIKTISNNVTCDGIIEIYRKHPSSEALFYKEISFYNDLELVLT
ncbi:MAG: hypothetical protein JW891_09865 [Candidatus Lokiarchaeota archaeon]|nr:hypothetical protein [Candidatus Lokiarchaeota archaeon]